jgi:hypothetical protein
MVQTMLEGHPRIVVFVFPNSDSIFSTARTPRTLFGDQIPHGTSADPFSAALLFTY